MTGCGEAWQLMALTFICITIAYVLVFAVVFLVLFSKAPHKMHIEQQTRIKDLERRLSYYEGDAARLE